jgi:hypothetical protein
VGKDAHVPFFSRKTDEMISVAAINITDTELRKWARNVRKIKGSDSQVPYICERNFTDDNLIIER